MYEWMIYLATGISIILMILVILYLYRLSEHNQDRIYKKLKEEWDKK